MNANSLFGPGAEDLWKKGKKRKRQGSGLTTGSNLAPEVLEKLGAAELHYINGEVQQAIDILSDITIKAPKLAEPYNILGLIYEDSHDFLRALQLYVLAATFTPKSLEIWKKVANIATILGQYDQAIHATKKCLRIEAHPTFYGNLIHLWLKKHHIKKARIILREFLNKFPGSIDFMVEFGAATEKIGLIDTALSAYLRYVFHWLGTDCIDNELLSSLVTFRSDRKSGIIVSEHLDLIFFAVRKAVDLLLQRRDGLIPSVELINISVECFQAITASMPLDSAQLPQFPSDLALLLGICQLRLASEHDVETGLAILNPLLQTLEADDAANKRNNPSNSSASGRNAGNVMLTVIDSDSEDDEENTMQNAINYQLPVVVPGGKDNNNDEYMTTDNTAATNVDTDKLFDLLSEVSIFLLRQRIRIADEFLTLGMTTRAEKLLKSTTAQLRVLMNAHTSLSTTHGHATGGENIVEKDILSDAATSIGNMWRDIGNVYCAVQGREEIAYGAYKTSMQYNGELNIEALSKYAELTRLHFRQNSAEVFGLLSSHFQKVVSEFESIRTNGTSSVFKSVNAGTSSSTGTGAASNMIASAEFVDDDEDEEGDISAMDVQQDSTATTSFADGDDDDDEEEALESSNSNANVGKKDAMTNGTTRHFNRNALQHEVFALIEWSYLFIDHSSGTDNSYASNDDDDVGPDYQSYCSIVVSLLEHWCFKSSVAAGIIDASIQKRRNKTKAIVSLHDLAHTDGSTHYADKGWLDEPQNVCGRFVSALCDYVNIEKLLGKPLLMEMATQCCEYMNAIGSAIAASANEGTLENLSAAEESSTVMSQMANELLHACTLMSLRRGCSQSKRRRKDKIGIAEREYRDDADYLLPAGDSVVPRRGRPSGSTAEPAGDSGSEYEEGESDDDDDSDYVQEEDNINVSTATTNKASSTQGKAKGNKMSTRKKKTPTGPIQRIRRNARMPNIHTGVRGGLMFNDFKNAIIADNSDPFILTARNYSIAVQNAATQLFSSPSDIIAANSLFRNIVAESTMFETTISSKYIEITMPAERLRNVKQYSVVSCIFAGHSAGLSRKLNDTLDYYLDAFCLDPSQPLSSLCVGTYLVMLANHSHIKHKHECLAKGLVFLHRYASIRRKQALGTISAVDRMSIFVPNNHTMSRDGSTHHDFLTEIAMHQETLYNLGRAFHDIRLYNLAADNYILALELADANPILIRSDLSVTREAAHNLVLIYRRSESFGLALEVMEKYLSFD